jgi:predicted flap endonuclease-1-like 5' DNA nuclease
MPLNVAELKGVSAELADKLHGQGFRDSDTLLDALKSPAERRALADRLQIGDNDILELANRADLARIVGIGAVYSNLLENAGVDTVVELSKRVPENLYAKIQEFVAASSVQRPPTLDDVRDWVTQAKSLERKLSY